MSELLYENKKYIVYCKKLICDELEVDAPTPDSIPFASIYRQDGLIPTGGYYSGVFPINVIGSSSNTASGFVNDDTGLIRLDETAPNAKEGTYLINWKLSLAVDNLNNPLSVGNGEAAILLIRDGQNSVYTRQGIGGYYASKPAFEGQCSIYNNMSGSFVLNLQFGDRIGLQALNIVASDQYKYNLAFTITYFNA